MVYAYVCRACKHLASQHHLGSNGDLRAGPYRCRHCPCEIAQDGLMIELDQHEFNRHFAATNPKEEP